MTTVPTTRAGAAASARRAPAIVCTGLVRIFASKGVEVQALQGLDLRVDAGELVAVVGASGSGKSTLLSILSSLDVPTAGAAEVAGRDLVTMTAKGRVEFRRRVVGFVWQQTARNLLPYLTAVENVGAALAVADVVPRRERATRAADLLELMQIGHGADRRPDQLSGGEQQRVAIAIALANAPEVLLADEPTGELDDETSAHVLEAMRAANRELGVTTLIVTHDPSVSEHVGRTVQIRDGRTSTEVLRTTEIDEEGTERHVAAEYAVLDRVGRLQLPEDFVSALDLRERVRLDLEPDHVAVRPGTAARPAESTADPSESTADAATPPSAPSESTADAAQAPSAPTPEEQA